MFVLSGKETKASVKDQSEMNSVIKKLEVEGYVPILRSMLRSACCSIGLEQDSLPVNALVFNPRFQRRPSPFPIGDILCLEDNLFLLNLNSQGNRFSIFEIHHHTRDSGLEDILIKVENAIKAQVDGRRVRGMNFDWKEVKPHSKRRLLRANRFSEEKLTMKEPDLTLTQLEQAKLLVSNKHRSFLLSLAQIGKARSVDAATISNQEITQPLLEKQLIRKEYIVTCRQDSRTLCSVPDEKDIGNYMLCTTCGRNFKDELIQEIYALTADTKKLINGSHWMTIWITNLLDNSGISKEKIKWNAAAGDDELDIIAEIQGMNVFFELKDRQFGLGDAYPFGFRLERYGGEMGVVLTMDKVAAEAQKFFEEQSTRRAGRIEYLEGEKSITEGLPDLIEEISRNSIELFFSEFSEELGLGILPLVQQWLRKKR
jgi:hypothetical protein